MNLKEPLLKTRSFAKIVLAIVLLCLQTTVVQQNALAEDQNYELEILSVLELLRSGELQLALEQTQQHLVEFPNSRIAHLIRADIYVAMSSGLNGFGQGVTQHANSLKELQDQIRNRWQQFEINKHNENDLIPSSLIDIGHHKYVIVADLEAGRLYLYQNVNGKPVLVKDYYLTVGSEGYGKAIEGDNKTPVGVYAINQHIPAEELPDLYGDGAYPVNYPNGYDRSQNRTGSGIWLHGTPSYTYARSPWASKGCFVLSNDDLQHIQKFISVKNQTPVVLSDGIKWLNVSQRAKTRNYYLGIIQKWQHDWESLNTELYLSHYSQENFDFGNSSFKTWANRKRAVNKAKAFIKVDLDIESVFVYPGEKETFVVQFKQDYKSSNYSSETQKQQYWQRDSKGRWKIIYEG